ncbi:phage portal protein [Bacillus sp. B-jedd]|uniref:phage portal protein n=1 Tax=Bacillus sp. B-jedd TaxID=1476857 RepID=UPI000515610D|nr:phage portal protein [Bacillus sp. B-jedd]CEG29807.1 Phage portal protein, lambda family [Bacillus sp. B-jedd]
MSWLDSAIAFLSPQAGYKREAWRKGYEELKSYDAGLNDRLNGGWRTVNASAEQTDGMYRETIRARGRDLERNSDIQESIIGAFERNVVGTGFKLQAKTADEELNTQIEKLWKEWCKPRNCDVTFQQSFSEICRMVIRRKKIDGGIILLKRYTKDGIVPFSLQVREVDDLDTMQTGKNGKRVLNGIEYNEFNRPIAYYFKTYDVYGFYAGKSDRIEAKDVIFLWNKKRPSQIREISEMSPTITRIRDVNSYMEAVSVKERVAACLSVFIKRQSPTAGSIGRQGKSASTQYEGKTLSPGMIMELNPGDDVATVNPPAQGASAADFVRLQQRLTGSGQGISYEAAARDMSQVNYSSARQGLLEDQKTYAIEQEFLIDHLLSEVYETFLISAVLSGALQIKDFWEKKREYMEHIWTPPGQKWIDPLKEANANRVSLETNQTTLAEIAASAGQDWKDVVDQRARELEYMKQKGVITNDKEKG